MKSGKSLMKLFMYTQLSLADLTRSHLVDSHHYFAIDCNVMMNFELNPQNLFSCDEFHASIHYGDVAVKFVLSSDVMEAIECKLLMMVDDQCVEDADDLESNVLFADVVRESAVMESDDDNRRVHVHDLYQDYLYHLEFKGKN